MVEQRGNRAGVFFAIAVALGLVVLVSCEHARHWRGSEPWSLEFRQRMSDPVAARVELARRMAPPAPGVGEQDVETASMRSAGCISCHGPSDEPDMHAGRELGISCVDCHGGDGMVMSPLGEAVHVDHEHPEYEAYIEAMLEAHVPARNPDAWYEKVETTYGAAHGHKGHTPTGSRNPENTYALLNHESPEFIRFINPGDLRVAAYACGACHPKEVDFVGHSMMAHGAQLWGAALYNNGSIPDKVSPYGESYSAFGLPERLQGVIEYDGEESFVRMPTEREIDEQGVVTHFDPLPVWNIAQPGNVLRIFERGTKLPVPGGAVTNPNPAEIGNPNPLVEGGRPDKGLSPRGLGTLNRTDPVFLGLQKTRLLDPILGFMGTNDHAGDFRSSGCTSCHVVYANDRDPTHSAQYASFGHEGVTETVDPTIPRSESGHPIRHVLTNAIPSSQCIVCHIHPGTSYANTYLGYMWWDNESDGEHLYPAEEAKPTDVQRWESLRKNPDDAAMRGLWGDLYPDAVSHAGDVAGAGFLAKTGEPRTEGGGEVFNDKLDHNQFADFHGHGWLFRAVHKKDREGRLLDLNGEPIDFRDPDKWAKAVHLKDVHLERGMHCIDCHFVQDMHGNGKLYAEVRNAVEITCVDCHGSYTEKSTFMSSGPAAPRNDEGEVVGNNLRSYTVFGRPRFFERGGILYQRSAVDPDVTWEVVQTVDTINPGSEWAQREGNSEAAELSRYAKTVRMEGGAIAWGDMPPDDEIHRLAHGTETMECYTCHTSWMTSCFGCHLPMQANERTPMLHNENLYTRNYTRYNFQVLRDDVYMLGRDSTVKGNRIVPVRSSSAVVVSSQNQNREWVYSQQQTISGEGYSGHPMNPHFPHATSGRGTTKNCTDCHVSRDGDNNAWMAQLLTQGTNFVNFFGRYVYVALGSEGLEGVVVTERDEPQAVHGSHLHELAFPERAANFEAGHRELTEAYHHGANGGEILDLQHRGEYLYTARGAKGFYAYDIANIDNKGFSERIVTAPVSPLGQDLGFDTSYAVCVASPSTLALDPARARLSDDPGAGRAGIMDPAQGHHVNEEQPIHPLYAYLYIGDRDEGLILTFAGTLLDGDPRNNFMERAVLADGSTAFNPDGVLTGLTYLTVAGHFLYATSDAGLVVIDIDTPTDPKVVNVIGSGLLVNPKCVQVQFRYAFITDDEGLKVAEVTDPAAAQLVDGAFVPLADAHRLYVSRTKAYVANGSAGVAIVDVTRPESPALDQMFNADGAINDARDIKVGMTNASLFAYVADGRNGLRVLQLMGPDTTPQFRGFSPPISPRLIATRHTHGAALAVSEGLDRDRGVDETGHQVQVFGRLGARPLNAEDMRRMYMRDGKVWTVTDEPDGEPRDYTVREAEPEESEEDDSSNRRRRRR
ncbi:MAG: hypothetical protein RLN60_04885 [Phycisphaerales bacterium]